MGIKTAATAAWNALTRKSGGSGPVTIDKMGIWFDALNGDAGYPYWTYALVAQLAFMRNVVVNKCVMDVSKAVGGLSWYLIDSSDGTEIDKHPLLDLIERPNKTQGKSAFFQHVQAYKLLDGNTFIDAVGPGAGGSGVPRELWVKRPDFVQILPGVTELPSKYIYTPGGMGTGTSAMYPVDQVSGACRLAHIRHFSPLMESQNMRGLSPVTAAIMQVLSHNEATQWCKNLIKHGVAPSGALTIKDDISDETVQKILGQLRDQYAGSRNSGKPMVLSGGMDFKPMSMTPKDADFVNLKDSAARDIAMVLGVPPILLHIPGDSTYNNVKDARMAFYEETVLAEARQIRDELNRWLVPMFGNKNLRLEINEDDISALFPRRQTKWQMVNTSTFLTTNEKRTELGFPTTAEGDSILVPANMVALGETVDDSELPDPSSGAEDEDE